MDLNELGKTLRVVGDEHRLAILCYLMKHRKTCVSDIAQDLSLSVATTSHHLQVLAKEELVVAVRDGKRICYALPPSSLVKSFKRFICAHTEF
ncbi:MAG: winged helix-turn-helix transcriptional regulator [Candidatus Moranbacteria bacterium]|nr:winged helix-turn-helix transcriptional regulator [Candidatus Moranbacteria bacterium]